MHLQSLPVVCGLGILLSALTGTPSLWSADAPLPVPVTYELGQPRAKMTSSLLPFLGQGSLTQALQSRLRKIASATRSPGTIPVRLDVVVTPATLAAISATGAVINHVSKRWKSVSVEATPGQLDALALLPDVHQMALLLPPLHSANAGDGVMHTDTVRTAFSIDGTGMSIGIVSDSVGTTPYVLGTHGIETGIAPNITLTNTIEQNSGSLPSSIQIVATETTGGSDEGEVMLEEVHAIAPGATLAFGPAGNMDTAMADNIALLHSSANCKIIADDIAFYDEPYFQDGPIAVAINDFRQAGGLYFSAAGNNVTGGILQSYTPVSSGTEHYTGGTRTPTTGVHFHNWGLGGTSPGFLPVIIPAGVTLTFIVQWNQPYQSYGTALGSEQDFDCYLYSAASAPGSITGTILSSSTTVQGDTGAASGDPWEGFQYQNTGGSPLTVYFAVNEFRGTPTAVLRTLIMGDGAYIPPSNTAFTGPTMFGHATATGAIAIAATPAAVPTSLEYFSSNGGWGAQGVPFYFTSAGAVIANGPTLRNKPDLTAPDGIAVANTNPAFNASFSGLPVGFYGTSAAAPNAAACAALVWLAHPNESNEQIAIRLLGTAGAMSSPGGSLPNAYAGFGLIDGIDAAHATVVEGISSTDPTGTYIGGTIPITVHFSNPVTVTGSPILQLNTTPAHAAIYSSGSATNILTFNYQITDGDAVSILEVASTTALSLGGGSIIDGLSHPALLTLPAPGATDSLSSSVALTVSAVDPSLSVTVPSTSSLPAILFTCTFSQAVSGFSASSIAVSNATKGVFTTVSPTQYTLAVTAIASGSVTATVSSAAAQNVFSYPSQPASATCTYTAIVSTTTSTTAAGTSGTTATSGTTGGTAVPTTSTTGGTGTATAAGATTGGASASGGGGGGCGLGGLSGIVVVLACTYWRRGRQPRLGTPPPRT